MARKSNSEKTPESTGNLINDLISDTQFSFITENSETTGSLSDKPKVKTPIHAFNDLLGGGLPLGAIIEVYGPNAAGKSSMLYETLGNFQRQYSNGVAFIIDSEASTDDARLRALGVDPSRAPRMGASSLEDGFEQINKILKKMIDNPAYKGFPVMVLWDTIAATPSRAQVKSGDMYAGGMAERARIIKASLTNMFPLVDKQNVLIVLLNQVMSEIGSWRPGLTSGGGHALKHDIHLKLKIDGGKTDFDGVYAIEKHSTLSIEKSKVSPLMNNIPITIDITKGGVINQSASLVEWMTMINPPLFKQASWWEVEPWVYEKYKPVWDKFYELGFSPKFRQKALYDFAEKTPAFQFFLRLIWIDLISERYTLQSEVCKESKSEIENQLKTDLNLSDQDLIRQTVDQLAINTETGEVVEDE